MRLGAACARLALGPIVVEVKYASAKQMEETQVRGCAQIRAVCWVRKANLQASQAVATCSAGCDQRLHRAARLPPTQKTCVCRQKPAAELTQLERDVDERLGSETKHTGEVSPQSAGGEISTRARARNNDRLVEPAMSSDPSTALESLSTSLSVLEAALVPFLATPLEETLAQNDGEPLQKAKLQVMVGYVVHDLIWSESTAPGLGPSRGRALEEEGGGWAVTC